MRLRVRLKLRLSVRVRLKVRLRIRVRLRLRRRLRLGGLRFRRRLLGLGWRGGVGDTQCILAKTIVPPPRPLSCQPHATSLY